MDSSEQRKKPKVASKIVPFHQSKLAERPILPALLFRGLWANFVSGLLVKKMLKTQRKPKYED